MIGHLSKTLDCTLPAALIAMLIDEFFPKLCDMLANPGDGSRIALGCGVRRGVGSNPNAGGSRQTVCEGDGTGSMVLGVL